jgi:hypothetical protein
MMQQRVDVVKDIPLGDFVVAVMIAKFRKRPVGDVLPSIRAVFVIGVKRKALRIPS